MSMNSDIISEEQSLTGWSFNLATLRVTGNSNFGEPVLRALPRTMKTVGSASMIRTLRQRIARGPLGLRRPPVCYEAGRTI
jgi:hypothetical protein